MTWWCAASDAAWDWSWRAYPGAWLAIALLVAWYVRWWRRAGVGATTTRERVWLGLGAITLWAAIDWPLGALGAGYLAWVHTVQFLLIALVAAPLLLLAIPDALVRRVSEDPRVLGRLRTLAHPILGLVVFNAILGVTHLPAVVDGLMRTQLGSFAVDVAWLIAGLALWWPVVAPVHAARISPPMQVGYLFVATIPPTVPAAFLTFAKYPLYGLYELAPRVPGLNVAAQADQQLAGLIMKVVGDPILWLAMAIVYFRWARPEHAKDIAPRTA